MISFENFHRLSIDQRVNYLNRSLECLAAAQGKSVEFHASMVDAVNKSLKSKGLPPRDFGEVQEDLGNTKQRWEKCKKKIHELNVKTLEIIETNQPKEEPIIHEIPDVMPIVDNKPRDVDHRGNIPIPIEPYKRKCSIKELFNKIIQFLKNFFANHNPFAKRKIIILN